MSNTTIQDFWDGAMEARERVNDLRMRAALTRFAREQDARRSAEAIEAAAGLRTDAACARRIVGELP